MATEMTHQAHQELEAERIKLARMHNEARERIEHAQNGGGDSEGLAGVEAVFEAEEIGARLARIERMLENVVIVTGGGDTVAIGSRIEIDLGEGVEAYTFDTRAGEGRIGRESPIGRALEGRKAGDTVLVEAPGGSYTVRLVSVQ